MSTTRTTTTVPVSSADPVSPGARVGPARALVRSVRAELSRLLRWPAVWVTIGAWLLLSALFGYVFDYLAYRTGDAFGPAAGASGAELLAGLLPTGLPEVLVQGMPMFGGALMLVLGAMVAGGGYGWGTWKTAYLQGPRRTTVAAGSLVALGLLVVLAVAASLVLDLGLALLVAAVEDQPATLPVLGDLARAAGAGLAVMAMWAALGHLLGTATRGTSLSVGLGLVWALVVENLLRGVGELLDPVARLVEWLPGTAAGSLVGALIGPGGAPGVLTTLSGPTALAVLAAYLVVLPALSLLVVRRRDVA